MLKEPRIPTIPPSYSVRKTYGGMLDLIREAFAKKDPALHAADALPGGTTQVGVLFSTTLAKSSPASSARPIRPAGALWEERTLMGIWKRVERHLGTPT